MDSKRALREKIIVERKRISPDHASQASKAIAEFLLSIIPNGLNVAGYYPTNGEIDIKESLNKLSAKGNTVSLPTISDTGKILKFRIYSPHFPLIEGKYGIFCPPPQAPEITPDIVIVPMVGFDKEGHRLGYGGGYYDATLAYLRSRNEKLLAIGVAYAAQSIEKIPIHNGDQKINMLVTEKEIVKFR